ncbi:MAG: hypothetical protein JWP82_2230 [Humibacillus sp.]|nr:hypothetical protein [Humibacillus sp.]
MTSHDGGTTVDDLARVVTRFQDIGDHLSKMTHRDPLEAVAAMAVEQIDRAEWASVTRLEGGKFRTVAATDDRARESDAVQYAVGSGPCLDAIVQNAVFRPSDLKRCPEWPEFGRQIAADMGVESMLSFRLLQQGGGEAIDGLNIYSRARNAFSDEDALTGLMVATHGSMAAVATANARKVAHLQQALLSSRVIGTAMGVIMSRHNVTRDQAFDLLRMASQNSNRKLRDVADEVTDTGELPLDVSGDSPRGDEDDPREA